MTPLALVLALALADAPPPASAVAPVPAVPPLAQGVKPVSPAAGAVAPVPAVAEGPVPVGPAAPLAEGAPPLAQGPDVELHVPNAEVQKLALEVENLQARLDLDTSVASLVRIQAGVVATVQKLKVQLEGVRAETHLLVRLDRVAEVMARALGSIDRHPDLAGAPGAPAHLEALPAVSVDAAPQPASSAASPAQE